jgi:glycerate kinase
MKILIAVNAFKGTLTSIQASKIIGNVFKSKGHKVQSIPIADGGDGTIDSIQYSIGGDKRFVSVFNPLGKKIKAYYILKGNTAYLEYAKSSGLALLKKSKLNPLKASSYGFGELINSALRNNIKKIVIGLGGSATNDVGVGMLSALGVKFYDKEGNKIKNINKSGAEVLEKIYDFDLSLMNQELKNIEIEILCDVKNPLYGKNGTSKIYSPQKGADAECVKSLENGVKHFAGIIEKKLKAKTDFEGAGAAGGMGAALNIFLNAKIISGIKGVMDLIKIENKIINSDLVITGEGSMDYQSAFGKAPAGVAELAKRYNKKVIAICGKTGKNAEELFKHGIDLIFSYSGDVHLPPLFLKRNAFRNLKMTAVYAENIINNYNELKHKIFIFNETKNFRNSPNTCQRN